MSFANLFTYCSSTNLFLCLTVTHKHNHWSHTNWGPSWKVLLTVVVLLLLIVYVVVYCLVLQLLTVKAFLLHLKFACLNA